MKPSVKIVLTSVTLAFLLNLFFGRSLQAYISTWPFLNRLKLLSPQAPIVINHREEITLADSGQISDAVSAGKSKISSVLLKDVNGLRVAGAAINLSSDGDFVAVKETFLKPGEYWLLLQDGRTSPVTDIASDPASDLVFFRSNFANVPTAFLQDSENLQSGEKVLYFALSSDRIQVWPDYISKTENDRYNQVMEAGKINRQIQTGSFSKNAQGTVLLNIKGEVVGLAGEQAVIPASVIKHAAGVYLGQSRKINRPGYDFSYQEISSAEVKIFNSVPGAKILAVQKNSIFKTGDVIVSVAGQTLGNGVFLEEILEKYKPGDSIDFLVNRAGQNLTLSLKVKELK